MDTSIREILRNLKDRRFTKKGLGHIYLWGPEKKGNGSRCKTRGQKAENAVFVPTSGAQSKNGRDSLGGNQCWKEEHGQEPAFSATSKKPFVSNEDCPRRLLGDRVWCQMEGSKKARRINEGKGARI